jgi:hypothetical protein
MPKYLTRIDFTRRNVTNPYQLKAGGAVDLGVYERTRRNMLKSPVLLRRISAVARDMVANCRLADACTTNPARVGKVRKGKVIRLCAPEDVKSRLAAARSCAIKVLPAAK